jgi:hypothetical protein
MIYRGTIIRIVKRHRLIWAAVFIVSIGFGTATWFAEDLRTVWRRLEMAALSALTTARVATSHPPPAAGHRAAQHRKAEAAPESWCRSIIAMMKLQPQNIGSLQEDFFGHHCERYALSPSLLPGETVDSVLKRLVAGAVAFNVPNHMRLARCQTLEARLGVNVPREQLMGEVASEGEVKAAQL